MKMQGDEEAGYKPRGYNHMILNVIVKFKTFKMEIISKATLQSRWQRPGRLADRIIGAEAAQYEYCGQVRVHARDKSGILRRKMEDGPAGVPSKPRAPTEYLADVCQCPPDVS